MATKHQKTQKTQQPQQPQRQQGAVWHDAPLIDDQDRYLFNEGNHFDLWKKLGAHPRVVDGTAGVNFAVWAPNARAVRVMGDFNGWDKESHELRGSASGIWEGFVPDLEPGVHYKFHILGANGHLVDKADPFSRFQEPAPQTASIVWSDDYRWEDEGWMQERAARNGADAPISVYELHPGSWMRDPGDPDRLLSYRELAPKVADYCTELGFTHVELLPIMEHPFYGSWGYQSTGYFAPSSRYGTPEDFKFFVDHLHQAGLGVILDWVPSHFPSDEFALSYFDGTHLFEHADPRQGYHPDWNSYIFNYGRNEVRAFLISSAMYWLEEFHIDGLRVDAVASMLYLDYSRKEGEWIPNEFGGRENLEAIGFLKQLNEVVYERHPDVQTIAEESTSWPMVSRPTYAGGLGFGMKWDMGWMHDTLSYMQKEPIHRQWHHHDLTFRMIYAFNENFMLPLSHDEVVHGKGSILDKMPGDEWQKFGNLRLLYSYMWTAPGKKLLFMGSEFGQWKEWNHDQSLDWHLADYDRHKGVQRLIGDLNRLYKEQPALHAKDFRPEGFEWVDAADSQNSVIAFLRKAERPEDDVLVVLNFTPIPRNNYRVGVPKAGVWEEIFNSDAPVYGGSGKGNLGEVASTPVGCHGRYNSLNLTLPPLGAIFLRRKA